MKDKIKNHVKLGAVCLVGSGIAVMGIVGLFIRTNEQGQFLVRMTAIQEAEAAYDELEKQRSSIEELLQQCIDQNIQEESRLGELNESNSVSDRECKEREYQYEELLRQLEQEQLRQQELQKKKREVENQLEHMER